MTQPQSGGQVFIVDDDEAVRSSLQFALAMEGLSVRAFDSAAAVLLAAGEMPTEGCLVIDYYMPAMNGLELVGRLRGRSVDLPVILITTYATREMRRRAAGMGVRIVLEKPLQDSALLDSIRNELGRAH